MRKFSRRDAAILAIACLFAVASNIHRLKATIVVYPTALRASQVVTSGTPVTALQAGDSYNGCYIQNDPNASTNLVIDPVNTASHSSPSGTASIIAPGFFWNCPAGVTGSTVTVDAFDSGHNFYGTKF